MFGASKLALYAANPPSGDPYYNMVLSLLYLDGSNGSTTFTDQISGRTWSRYGTTTQISTTQYKFGTASASMTGGTSAVSNGLYLTSSAIDYAFGTGDFTIEFWAYFNNSADNNNACFIDFRTGAGQDSVAFNDYLTSATGGWRYNLWMGGVGTGSITMAAGQWYFIVVQRASGVFSTYIDGTRDINATVAKDLNKVDSVPKIGTRYSGGGGNVFNGYIDGIRITKGVARYSGASITVPTADFPNTQSSEYVRSAWYLIVAGGGAGGGYTNDPGNGGGGGAGGLLTGNLALNSGTVYSFIVGGGGSTAATTTGRIGNNSSGFSVTSIGGGYGGAYSTSGTTPAVAGGNGGSGGGGPQYRSGVYLGGSGTTGQGYAGGKGTGASAQYGGGGGGGATAVGANQSGTNQAIGGAGGAGAYNLITGANVAYAGGGGGATHDSYSTTQAAGGVGGGGAGAYGAYTNRPNAGVNGTAYTGGGGGGGGGGSPSVLAGNGGSGVVIVRIPTSFYTGTTTGSPTVTTDGNYTILKYTSSGTYTA